jgi:hypothetical protein
MMDSTIPTAAATVFTEYKQLMRQAHTTMFAVTVTKSAKQFLDLLRMHLWGTHGLT